MEVDRSIQLQKLAKDMSEDIQREFLDIKNWEEQMKRAESDIRNTTGDFEVPPIRSKKIKTDKKPKKINTTEVKRIKSFDYAAWEKFNADKACKEVDEQDESNESEIITQEELQNNYENAMKHKQIGNIFVKQQQWNEAHQCYTKALKFYPHEAVFYANRALCHLKMNTLHSAEEDCTAAIHLDETYVKAYHRRATARIELGKFEEAKYDVEKILSLEPNNKEAKSMLSTIAKKIKNAKPVIIADDSEAPIEKNIGKNVWDELTMRYKKKNVNKSLPVIVSQNDSIAAVQHAVPELLLVHRRNVAVVNPTVKPPHQRSKMLLRRIPVREIDFDVLSSKCVSRCNVKKTCVQKIKLDTLIEDRKDDITSRETCTRLTGLADDDYKVPPVPKTAIQFIVDWKENKYPEYRYKYLQQIPAGNIHLIFQDSMDSEIFSEIIEILKTEFIKRCKPVFAYLKDLSQLKRFRTLVMFMSHVDKEALTSLFLYCHIMEGRRGEEFAEVEAKYGN
ncbi:RNA polymerase II-associated protein 3 [Orussus abietinus]|uniref:RNA polymerase II-associated protein 3 n=1 Tax=Orussus abietinus TaxID=222816 RepID=UPI0006269CCD|nr:RNA polymerase II-associated protein 3 [Orussus abietinus]XP_023289606.1 RNA polymerase II-associated protein 3 [Orussus abietinus]